MPTPSSYASGHKKHRSSIDHKFKIDDSFQCHYYRTLYRDRQKVLTDVNQTLYKGGTALVNGKKKNKLVETHLEA